MYITELLTSKAIKTETHSIYLRAFKTEGEFWAKNNSNTQYRLLKTYDICAGSGDLDPKRKQGDYLVPEGFYHIDRFNPWSKLYLSLGINYPNTYDKFLAG